MFGDQQTVKWIILFQGHRGALVIFTGKKARMPDVETGAKIKDRHGCSGASMIVHARVLDYKLQENMHSYSAFFSILYTIQTLYLTLIAVLNHQLT